MVNPTELTFTAVEGGPATPQQTATVVHKTGQTVRLKVQAPHLEGGDPQVVPPWIRAGPIQEEDFTPITYWFWIEPATMKAGTYVLVAGVGEDKPTEPFIPFRIRVNVLPPAPKLDVAPSALRFEARAGSPTAMTQSLLLRNLGTGKLTPATVTPSGQAAWLSVSLSCADPSCTVTVTARPAGLNPGTYYDTLKVSTAAGPAEAPVTLAVRTGEARLELDPAGLQFEGREGNGVGFTRTVSVLSPEGQSLDWTVGVAGDVPWLQVTPASGTSTDRKPGEFSVAVDSARLAPGDSAALLRVSAGAAVNTPQIIPVVVRVLPAARAPGIVPAPAGLILRAAPGTPSAAQVVSVAISSNTPIPIRAGATTDDPNGTWLKAALLDGGLASTARPARLEVKTDRLNAGVYSGSVNLATDPAGGEAPRVVAVNVLAVVAAGLGSSAVRQATTDCVPKALTAVHTALPRRFQSNVGWPTPVSLTVVNDCGQTVAGAQVSLSFSNGDPALVLQERPGGVYTATWTPRTAATSVTLTARFTAGGLAGSAELGGAVAANQTPVLAAGGVVNNLHPRAGAPAAPGMIVAIYGSDLAAATGTTAFTGGKLPVKHLGSSVLIGGREAPLFFVSPGQINAQVPAELAPNRQHQLLVAAGGGFTVPAPLDLAAAGPGIAAFADRRIIAQHGDYSLIDAAKPAAPGEAITIYLVGMGQTTPAVPSGQQAPAEELAWCALKPEVTIDGKKAELFFAGLTPGAVGLYQINLRVPEGVAAGSVSLVVKQGEAAGNETTLPVARPPGG